jgi:hypothetical protein
MKQDCHNTDNITKFLVYCIEIYKTAFKKTGKDVIRIFNQYGILDYIVKYYGALHTTGPEYIINDIDSLIEERQNQ